MARISRIVASASLELLKRVAAGLTPGDRSYLARQLMQSRFAPGTRALADLFNKSVLAWKNKQYDVELNGEAALLRRLAPFKPRILFDVGANVGDWSVAACAGLPDVHVHAFEISPATAIELAKNVQPFGGRVTLNTVGLGSREGEIQLFWSPESSTASSTIPGVVEISAAEHGIKAIHEITAAITTGDAYLSRHQIENIDFLKIDVEGAEWEVLQGFAEAFAGQKIQMVQFEYGPLSLKTRVLLADFAKFLAGHGFVLGKLFPEGVAFKEFDLADEDFVGPNYIAVRSGRGDLIEGLRCASL